MDGWISFFLVSSPHSGHGRGGASTAINPDHFLVARLLCEPVCLSLMEAAKKVPFATTLEGERGRANKKELFFCDFPKKCNNTSHLWCN